MYYNDFYSAVFTILTRDLVVASSKITIKKCNLLGKPGPNLIDKRKQKPVHDGYASRKRRVSSDTKVLTERTELGTEF